MSRRLHRAPLAVASDGTVLVNLAHFDYVTTIEDAVARAMEQHGSVFVGVAVEHDELAGVVLPRMNESGAEIAAYIVGRRRGRGRRPGKK